MNEIFKRIISNASSARPFIEWYNIKYPGTLSVFQNLPFTFQLGVYLEYFETLYKLVVMVNTHMYTVNFSDNRNTPLRGENNFTYNHYKYDHAEPSTIIHGYELAVLWLFENFDVPF